MAGRAWAQVTHAGSESSAGRAAQTLWGVVLDPSGAVVPNATLTLTRVDSPDSLALGTTTHTDGMGRYVLSVAPGTYALAVRAAGFAEFQTDRLELQSRWPGKFDVRLKMETQLEQVDVLEDPAGPQGAGALVLSPEQIEQLPMDPLALLDRLQSLAGGSGAELYVEGFSGAKLPPRSQIREIRINQNPYSAQNDVDPMSGTIQILTRPGSDRLHGDFYMLGDLSQLNARNPFTPEQPSYYAFQMESSVSGMMRPRASYFANYSQIENRLNSLVDARAIAASGQTFPRAVAAPLSTIDFSPRLDLQPAMHSTMSLRYAFNHSNQINGGVGQLALSTRGYDSTVSTHTLQFSNSQSLGEHAIDDTRLQYIRQHSTQSPVSSEPAIAVEGIFSGGGSSLGSISDHLDKFELQNYFAVSAGRHYLNMGGRLRTARDANRSTAGFNGEFIFSSLDDYQNTASRTGYSASEFIQTTGDPHARVLMADAALFAQDDWKAAPGLTLSYGLRLEEETFVPGQINLAPRAGFSKALGGRGNGKAARYTLHGGAGVFYRRFPMNSALTVIRENGVTEQQYVIPSPRFFGAIPERQTLGTLFAPAVYRVSPRFRTPYYIGTTLALDRQLGRKGSISVSWLYNRGVHTELIENVNAPLPGTYTSAAPELGTRPLGTQGNNYEFASDGIYRSTRLYTTLNLRPGRFSLYCFYIARFETSDAESGSFPSVPYRIGEDYGRANDDVRHVVTVRGAVDLPRGFSMSGYVHATSGAPFNIVLSRDVNGDTQFNDRPAYATDLSRASVVGTRWGVFDTDPQPGQTIIPRNLGEGPGFVLVDLALGKSFGIGPAHKVAAPSGASTPAVRSHGSPATLDFMIESQNLLNHPNLTAPIGTLGSPHFGKSVAVSSASALSGDRIVNLVLSIRF